MNWISVKDKLPESNKDLITYKNRDGTHMYEHCYYLSDTNEFYDIYGNDYKVTHWQYLCPPPEDN